MQRTRTRVSARPVRLRHPGAVAPRVGEPPGVDCLRVRLVDAKNGELLAAAEGRRFDVLVTTDTQLKYQQNLRARSIAIVVLGTTSWPRISAAAASIAAAVDACTAGTYLEVEIP